MRRKIQIFSLLNSLFLYRNNIFARLILFLETEAKTNTLLGLSDENLS